MPPQSILSRTGSDGDRLREPACDDDCGQQDDGNGNGNGEGNGNGQDKDKGDHNGDGHADNGQEH